MSIPSLYRGRIYTLPGKTNQIQFGSVFKWNAVKSAVTFAPAVDDDASWLAPYVFSAGDDSSGVDVKVAFVLVNDSVMAYLYHSVEDTAISISDHLTLTPTVTIPAFFSPGSSATCGIVQVQDMTNQETLSSIVVVAPNGVISLTGLSLIAGNTYIVGDTYAKLVYLGSWLT